MNSKHITTKEGEILAYWKKFPIDEPPTVYKAMKDLGYKDHSFLHKCVRSLVDKGLMTTKRKPGKMGNVYMVVVSDDRLTE